MKNLILGFVVGVGICVVGAYLVGGVRGRVIDSSVIIAPVRDPAKKYEVGKYIECNKYLSSERLIDNVVVFPIHEFQYGIRVEASFRKSAKYDMIQKELVVMMNGGEAE